ncbi:MAG: alpha/beta hydrolase, partial [Nitriliruptorales bacterium]
LLGRDWRGADEASLGAALVALDGGRAPDEADLAAITAPTGVVGWPADPAHPFKVAREWAELIPCGALEATTMADVGRDLPTLGRAAVTAWGKGGRS